MFKKFLSNIRFYKLLKIKIIKFYSGLTEIKKADIKSALIK